MNRNEFIGSLIAGLGAAPENEKAEIVGYYNELIDDGVESGKSEEEVIASFGEPGEIVRGTAELFQRKKAGAAWARGLKIGLLILFSPVILALFISAFAVLISLFSSAAGLLLGGAGYFLAAFRLLATDLLVGLFQIGASLMCIGCGALLLVASIQLWRLSVRFSAYFMDGVGRLLMRGEIKNA